MLDSAPVDRDAALQAVLEATMIPDEEIIFLNREIVKQNGKIIEMNFKMLEWINKPFETEPA